MESSPICAHIYIREQTNYICHSFKATSATQVQVQTAAGLLELSPAGVYHPGWGGARALVGWGGGQR